MLWVSRGVGFSTRAFSYLTTSVGGVKVSIVAFQAIDPGSIPGWRTVLHADPPPYTHPLPIQYSSMKTRIHILQHFSCWTDQPMPAIISLLTNTCIARCEQFKARRTVTFKAAQFVDTLSKFTRLRIGAFVNVSAVTSCLVQCITCNMKTIYTKCYNLYYTN